MKKRKFLVPIVLAVSAFVLALIATAITLSSFHMKFGIASDIANIMIALALPVFMMDRLASGKKDIKPILIAAAVLLCLQIVGNLITIPVYLIRGPEYFLNLHYRYTLFSLIPGAQLFSVFASEMGLISLYGFEEVIWEGMVASFIITPVIMLLSTVLYILSDFVLITVCSEYYPVPQLDNIRIKLYDILHVTEDDPCGDTEIKDDTVCTEQQKKTEKIPAPVTVAFSEEYADTDLPAEMLVKKNIVLCIILSLITCGIYSLVWQYSIIKKIRMLNGEKVPAVAGEFLCFIFVPFYALYWYYTRAERLTAGAAAYNIHVNDNKILYLLLGIFGFPIINTCLIQNDLNMIADVFTGQYYVSAAGTKAADQPAAPYANAGAQAKKEGTTAEDPIDQLKKIAELHNEGILTDEEFIEKKEELLKRI